MTETATGCNGIIRDHDAKQGEKDGRWERAAERETFS